jgi:1-acyl-sn-glycerol-3-phosphate acyltransferase
MLFSRSQDARLLSSLSVAADAPAPPRYGPGSRLSLLYFFAAIGIVGGLGVSACAPFLIIGRWWRRPRRIGHRMFAFGVRCLLRCQPWLDADVRIGSYEGATLYVSNHRSTLEVFFLLAYVPGVRILSKRTLLLVPFLGEVMLLTRQIFVSKGRPNDFLRAMRQVESGLRAGDTLHVFPEYTRCPPGLAGTQKFSLAPFQVAKAVGVRVVPIVFRDTDRVWPKGLYSLSWRRPVRVVSLDPLHPDDFDSARSLMRAAKERIDAELAHGGRAS